MLQAESPSLRQKFNSFRRRLEGGGLEQRSQVVKGVDMAAWKLILSHTKAPSLRSAKRVLSSQRQEKQSGCMGQMQTLELYGGALVGKSGSRYESHTSPLSSQESVSFDWTSLIEASERPTLVIWPSPAVSVRDGQDGEYEVQLEGKSSFHI